MYKKILVPLDGSIFSEQAIPYATALARNEGSKMLLMRVANHPDVRVYVENTGVFSVPSDDSPLHCQEYLERIALSLREQGFCVETNIGMGDIAEELLKKAKSADADVVVMTSHGRTGIGRMIMGSVADEVLRHANMPVMIVRPK